LNFNILRHENGRIGIVLEQNGYHDKAVEYLNDFKAFADQDNSIYKHIHLCMYFAYQGKTTEAIEQFRLFSEENNFHYWTILFLKQDPMIDNIKNLPEFNKLYKKIENKFWNYHKKIKTRLTKQGLLNLT